MPFEYASVGIQTIHARIHDHIQHQQVDGALLKVFNRLLSAGNRGDLISQPGQNPQGQFPLFLHVVYN